MKKLKSLFTLILGALTGYILAVFIWIFWRLIKADPVSTLQNPVNKAPKGISFQKTSSHKKYTIQRVVENGIERISYFPTERCFETPLLLQHGMWHGAWCWQPWQELLATWGWESHAISLPGHGNSPLQRPIPECTLDYYLNFIQDEAKQFSLKPVLIGHSMGGALTQWYLKHVGELPAVVFVASWVAHSTVLDRALDIIRQDPAIVPLMLLSRDATSWVRNPRRAAEKLLGPRAITQPDELHPRLGPESALVLFQHNPPFWHPPRNNRVPSLWLAGELDAVVSAPGLRKSAQHFNGDFVLVPQAGHNLMMEHNAFQTVETIHKWLTSQNIP